MVAFVWIAFLVLILLLLALDLGVFHRDDHTFTTSQALRWTFFWIALAGIFDVGVYFLYENHWLGIGLDSTEISSGSQAAVKFLTGYLIEKSLSLDNIAVIAMIFTYFRVPLKYQHRTLFWGILGALILRGALIGAGAALIRSFTWMIYVFGGFLLFTAFKMLRAGDEAPHLENNRLVRLARRIYPVTTTLDGHRFFTHLDGRRAITPLFLVLLLVESSDVIFAVDSIPAIFAVTLDPFIVFTSNIFALLGLRSLYFVLASLLDRFRYLKLSLVFILAYVGVKMIISHYLPIPSWVSLGVIVLGLTAGIVFSLWRKPPEKTADAVPATSPDTETDPAQDDRT